MEMAASRDERGDEVELSRGRAALLPCRQIRELEPVYFLTGRWVNGLSTKPRTTYADLFTSSSLERITFWYSWNNI